MCGLVGIRRFTNERVDREEIDWMVERIRHRGPDDSGVFVDSGIGLGHVRLSILDLSPLAAQPMVSADGRYTIVYNGEIYNFSTLREALTERGIEVRSTGDTEVFLEHLAAFGVDQTLKKAEGFFAFALWDGKKKRLTVARDRHGIKPLYYRKTAQGVEFASELKALLRHDARPDPVSINAALLGSGGTWGEHTLFAGIRSVLPGQILQFDTAPEPEGRQFFRLRDFVDPAFHAELCEKSDGELMELVEQAMFESIDLRLISDVPVACLVSGGLDSSLVTAMAGKRQSNLTLYHADVTHNSEYAQARRLASHFNLELRTARVTDDDFFRSLADVTYYNDAPVIYHPNSVPFYLVSRLANEDKIKVLLTGEGSDEYFLGYPRNVLEPYIRFFTRFLQGTQNLARRAFPRLASLLFPRAADWPERSLGHMLTRYDSELAHSDSEAAMQHIAGGQERSEQATSLFLTQPHLTTLLHRNDRLAMAWGIESRFPFLGHTLARLALNLPLRMKLRHSRRVFDVRHPFFIDKYAVRKLGERFLPKDIVRRPKKGFPVSVAGRLKIDPAYFYDGFVADWYGLRPRAIDKMIAETPRQWASRLVFLNIWGQLFFGRRTREEERGRLLQFLDLD